MRFYIPSLSNRSALYIFSYIGYSILDRVKKKVPPHWKEISSVHDTVRVFNFAFNFFPYHWVGHPDLFVRSAKQVIKPKSYFWFFDVAIILNINQRSDFCIKYRILHWELFYSVFLYKGILQNVLGQSFYSYFQVP